jgi:hypothetical protein
MREELPPCPKCNGHDFNTWKLPHPVLLHWVLNPGLVANELVLGQRIPRQFVYCLSCALPRNQRSFFLCPGCNTLHDARIWQGKQGFWNWLGLVCPSCGERIPCLWNVFSLAILAVTTPVWFFPVRSYRRHAIPARPTLEHLDTNPPAPNTLRLALF